MSSRKPGYLIGVILLALVMSAPQILVLLQTGAGTFFGIGSLPFRSRLLGVGSPVLFGGSVWSAAFWRDRLVFISDIRGRKDGTLEWVVSTIDVETGKITDLDLGLTVPHGIVPVSIGDRLWFASHNGAMPVGSSFELVENALQRVPFVVPISTAGDDQRFLLDGEPACVVATPGSGFQVSTFTAGKWGNNRDVVLPTRYGEETFNFKYHSHLSCLNHGDGTHVFLHYGLRLFHRDGLELQAVDATGALLNGGTGHSATAVNEAVSALRVANSDGATTGWTLVREQPNALPTIFHSNQDLFGMVVGGQPAAMIVDDSGDFQPVGHCYRFDGAAWSEFATQTFPFGTNQIRVLPSHGGQKTFVVATSRTGAAHIFAVETTGIRPTNGASQHNQIGRAHV